jgi:transketolase
VLDFYRQSTAGAAGEECEAKWNTMFNGYATAYPELAAEFNRRMRGELPPDWKKNLPVYSHQEAKSVATRNRSEEVLNAIAGQMPELVGGSADLSMSNLVVLKVRLRAGTI